jgi:hypothetical protein
MRRRAPRGKTEAPGLTPQDKDARRKYIPLDAFIERMTELWTYDNRLATRLGSDDEICRAYSTATSALVQALDPMNDVKRGQPYTKDRERQLLSIDDTATEALRALHDAAARRVGLKRRT